jgi:hypothetical protein
VERDAPENSLRKGNSAWDGRKVQLFGARNEVLAFQVVVEADGRGIEQLTLSLPELRLRGDAKRIVYAKPALDPTLTVDRPIRLYSVNYLNVTQESRAEWVWKPGGPAAPADTTGWKPVQLVPENAKPGRGGFPVSVPPSRNQAFWIEIDLGRDLPAGTYDGEIAVQAASQTHSVPVELEVLDFALPDENSLDVMVFYEPDQPRLYQGRELDAAYHRFAHGHRVELVHAYNEQSVQMNLGRFRGDDFTAANGYEGPGKGRGNRIVPLTFYGPGRDFDERSSAWRRSDAWMDFLAKTLPGAQTFLYVPDEPGPSQYPYIRTLADNVHSNPGPGRKLPVFVTKHIDPALEGAIDIWCAPPQAFNIAAAAQQRAMGRKVWFYNGGRPHGPAIVIDAPATEARVVGWAAFKHDVDTYFYWHGVHWRHNSQKQGERRQNVWAEPITFDNRGQPRKPIRDQGYINGDGVLIYPGEEKIHPEEDRGIPGPIATIQLANLRRGLQDHQYLTLARRLGLEAEVREALAAVVPRVFSDARETVGFAETGDAFEAARRRLATAILSRSKREIKTAVLFGTPEADRILETLQVFPPDNPWNQDISALPVHADSAAIIESIGRDKNLDYNLDMNFVIVPPDQKRVQVKILLYPAESDPGPFPVPENAPIENWPLARNEDRNALARPGQTLDDIQRNGTGDRHLLIVDPFNGKLHEFWQARKTDAGWEAANVATFDLRTGALRPERWTSADAAGLPVFPAAVRFDECERGLVGHAMRVTVRRSRRGYVLPATHWASRSSAPNLPRMGERLRLRRDFDTSGFPRHARAILEGLKKYGMFVADNGKDWLISISPDARLQGLETLTRVKGADFEVVDTGARSVVDPGTEQANP